MLWATKSADACARAAKWDLECCLAMGGGSCECDVSASRCVDCNMSCSVACSKLGWETPFGGGGGQECLPTGRRGYVVLTDFQCRLLPKEDIPSPKNLCLLRTVLAFFCDTRCSLVIA